MTDEKFIEEVLDASNTYRQRHRAPPLKLNKDISKVSQSWADYLAKKKDMFHNPNATYKGKTIGENLTMHYNSDKSASYPGSMPVRDWYTEIKDYDFKTHSAMNTGHFTQLVWRETKELGVARARSSDGTWIVVCNYYPMGNIRREYGDNVKPSTHSTSSERSNSSRKKSEKSNQGSSGLKSRKTEQFEKIKNGIRTVTVIETITKSDGTKTKKTTVTKEPYRK